MALINLSEVSQSFVTLIHEGFRLIWGNNAPGVLPEPPARITGEGLGFYLYHAVENKTYANFPPPGSDRTPVRLFPMGLTLYYQLSANSILDDGTGAYNEQRMMGIAMKVLHDYPIIDDDTQINGITVMATNLRGKNNRFKVMFLPVPYNEAVNYWTAGSTPVRLSAYYEVSVIFLEPEEPTSYAGRVLTYGNYIFTEGQPVITASQNLLSFSVPGQSNPVQIKLQPAQAPPGDSIDFFGTGFNGNQLNLLLLNTRWPEPALATPGWNPAKTAGNQLTVTIGEKATLANAGTVVDVLPGLYNARVQVIRTVRLPGGEVRSFTSLSNQTPFTISPRINSINFPPGTVVTVKGYLFQHPDLPSENLEVFLGEHRITPDDGSFAQGMFRVTAPGTLEINIPTGLISGQSLPVRILINGAESPPNWIQIP
jgi:hypothetical protein